MVEDGDDDVLPQPHAFHLNMPPHFMDEDGVPTVTKFAAAKAKQLVDLAFSINLSPHMFEQNEGSSTVDVASEDVMMDEDDSQPIPFDDENPDTLLSVAKRCTRLVSLFSSLENLKYSGISTLTTMKIVLHLLKLLTVTITYDGASATLHYENVGTILKFAESTSKKSENKTTTIDDDLNYELHKSRERLQEDLARRFALPTPSRELLMLTLINLLSNKGPLRAVSNASVYTSTAADNSRSLLILQWKPLLRMILKTAPYLDEHKTANPIQDSNSHTSTVLKRSVQLVRDARHFFEQGVRPSGFFGAEAEACKTDQTSKAIWDMVYSDVMFHSHTHACYRGTILLYLFSPSRCSQDFYTSVLPKWWEAWTNIDRCPEYDFLWLALFCRARKHVKNYDWSPIRRRLLTHSQYWLHLPIGGAALDKSFPRAANPRSRSCPPRLKVFVGTGSSYDEGIDFVAKVAKLLVSGLGSGTTVEVGSDSLAMSEGTNDVLRFFSFTTPYFNPSNLGHWTFTLGAFLHYFAYELCCRMGAIAGNHSLLKSHPAAVAAFRSVQLGSHCSDIPPHEVVALLDSLLPLCQQALYSKNGHVGRAGEAAMLYLIQIDSARATPSFIDFACRALDISAVNLSHQAPAALSALTRLVQPALRSNPGILLVRLPEILRLSLAGIDSNDQNKTIRTLILYRSLTSWIPIGSRLPAVALSHQKEMDTERDGTRRLGICLYSSLADLKESSSYKSALDQLPASSLLKQGVLPAVTNKKDQKVLLDDAMSAMGDWSLEFLEKVFGLFRASGEREKTAKRASGAASRHSSADVQQARNFSRVLKECLVQLFASMNDDTHKLAIQMVSRFLQEETLLKAAKDVSLLCQAAAAARSGAERNPGLDAFAPMLTIDLSHVSTKTVRYRLRCLAGAVRSAGTGVVSQYSAISSAITFSLSSEDRHVFKTGCKLLRHTLSTLVEAYPISSNFGPRWSDDEATHGYDSIGKSAQLQGDSVHWHVPSTTSISLAWDLIRAHIVERMDTLCSSVTGADGSRSNILNSVDIVNLRRCLRVIRYGIRGGSSIFLDSSPTENAAEFTIPYEYAYVRMIDSTAEPTRTELYGFRRRVCSFLVVLSSVIASETLYPDGIETLPVDDTYRKTLPLISGDPKICKETSDISLLLLTRRGAVFRSQEAFNIWKAQKQLASDFILSAQVDHIDEVLQSTSLYGEARTVLFKDGEDGGKSISRRLLVSRVQLFHASMQRSASFEIPRKLRRLERDLSTTKNRLFRVKKSLPDMMANLEKVLKTVDSTPLDAYEGLADGLYALCCHSNTHVRASALSVIDYTMTRFGWLVSVRVPRLLSGLALEDNGLNGKFGIPSCSSLVQHVNQQGKRKKLAEAVKGVCSILSLSRAMKHVLQSDVLRFQFIKTVCGTDDLISMLPTEEMQKLVHYLQAVFSPFRSRFYYQPKVNAADSESHAASLKFVLDMLSEKKLDVTPVNEESSDGKAAIHWRKMLLAGWFLLATIEAEDLKDPTDSIAKRAWSSCFRILETEKGQPLQRVALGLLGRLVHLVGPSGAKPQLQEKMKTEAFCKSFGEALVYDHKEDTSVGGGHDAQWAAGVEDIIRESGRHVAPRTLFPFQRTSQASGSFKAGHAHLLELILSSIDADSANAAIQYLLQFALEMAGAPPSEDQKNQQVTSAEIYAGVCGSFLRMPKETYLITWDTLLLQHLDDSMTKIPFALSGAYFDAIRYALQFRPPSSFFPLTLWLVDRIGTTLWQSTTEETANSEGHLRVHVNSSSTGSEGFTTQSKWLYLFTAVLIEMDESEASNVTRSSWYQNALTESDMDQQMNTLQIDPDLKASWKLVVERLLPRLTAALGHPFDSCRDHISRCFYRICYCHRKRERMLASRTTSQTRNYEIDDLDPGTIAVQKLASLENSEGWSFNERYNALSTARRFIAYSVHLGEAKFEYSDFVIPLLPLAFESIKSTISENDGIAENGDQDVTANRALEAEVVKAFRGTIAEVSITAVVSYGKPSDISQILDIVKNASEHKHWQVRHAAVNFLRCFQGAHKFLYSSEHSQKTMEVVVTALADERREVSSAGMSALTGILAALSTDEVFKLVNKYILLAAKSKMKRLKKGETKPSLSDLTDLERDKELKRSSNQKSSVFFLCAAVMAQPYDTPKYVPAALAAISKHSFERNAPLGVRDTVKRCCADYKKTHMSDNWELHRSVFSEEQLDALEDVVSTPHYYA